MSFDLITAVNNKLNAALITMDGEINQIYSALASFVKQNRSDMVQLENRVDRLERNVNLLYWQSGIEYQVFNGVEYPKLDDASKIICLTRDFYEITKGEWTTLDLLLLKTAMKNIGILPDGKIGYFDFIKRLASDPILKMRLLKGNIINTVPEPYLIPLYGIKKWELLQD